MFGLSVLLGGAAVLAFGGLVSAILAYRATARLESHPVGIFLGFVLATALWAGAFAAGYEGYQRSRMLDSQKAAHAGG